MFSKIGYYIFVIPISHLPLPVLYVFTDILYLVFISVFPYRKKVIDQNLEKSFPSYTEKDRKIIKRKFYRHLTDLLAESVRSLAISEGDLRKRLKVRNPDVMQSLFNKNKNALLVSGHYNNWEWLVLGQGLLFDHKAYGVGKPMTSKFWDEKINKKRSRYGMNVIHANNYKEELKKDSSTPKAVLVLSDQSPGNSSKSYWMNFLHQPTAVLFGAELMAHDLNYAVVYFIMHKVKRGHYEIELKLVTSDPTSMSWGEITEAHTQLLENDIQVKPENWLWSHKRWKREIPENLQQLIKTQRENFNKKFNK